MRLSVNPKADWGSNLFEKKLRVAETGILLFFFGFCFFAFF